MIQQGAAATLRLRVQTTPYQREPGYAERYRDHRFTNGHGRRTDQRERAVLQALLREAALGDGPWLDVPSGTGRLSGLLPGPVVQVDRAAAMLAAIGHGARRVRACATAMPFARGVFAGALCCRLLQHLPTPAERIAVLAELARTTRGPIVVSFFDAASILHLRRLLRRALGKPPSGRCAITRGCFRREAAAAGLQVVRLRSLGRFLAEQTFALCLPQRRGLPHPLPA